MTAFVDFVNDRTTPYDDNGHGTHVSGIIAGNGYDSQGARAGIAPGAHIVSLKVLDADGRGVISDVIAALEWAIANKDDAQHPRRQPVGWRGGHRVLQDRSADAGRQARGRRRHRGRCRGRQPGQERRGPAAVRRHHLAGQRALGSHGGRVERRGHGGSRRRRDGAVQLARTVGDRLRGQAGSRGPWHRRRVAERCRPARSTRRRRSMLLNGTLSTSYKPYLSLTGHQHGRAGRRRHGGADGSGQSRT